MNKKVVLEFDANTKKVDEKVEGLKENVSGVKSETSGAVSQMDKFSGGAVTAFKNGVKGARGLIASMTTLKGAIISTGIGALVIAVVALIQAMSRLQRVQDQYKQLTAGLSIVMDVLLDTVALLGEQLIIAFTDPKKALEDLGKIIKDNLLNRLEGLLLLIPRLGKAVGQLFSGDFKEAGKTAADAFLQVTTGVEDFTDKLEDAAPALEEYAKNLLETAKKAAQLEEVEQKLADLQISQIKTQAVRNKQIAEARLLAEDETLSFEERTKALENALALEQKNLDEKLSNARVEADLIKQRNALSESSREDRRAEAEAIAKVSQLEEQSLKQQKRVFTELQSLQKQQQAERDKADADKLKKQKDLQKAEDEISKALLEATNSDIENEILASEQKYNKLLDLAVQFGLDTAELEEQQRLAIDAINDKYNQIELNKNKKLNADKAKQDKELKDSRVQIEKDALGAITGLVDAFGGASESSAKKAFQVNKLLGIAEAVVNTSRAITAQLAVPQDALTGANFVKAGIAAATGIAQIAKIKSTSFGSSSSGGGSVASAGGGEQQTPQTPSVDFGFLQQGAQQNTIQAYVLEQNVSNSQQANQLIQDQASL